MHGQQNIKIYNQQDAPVISNYLFL